MALASTLPLLLASCVLLRKLPNLCAFVPRASPAAVPISQRSCGDAVCYSMSGSGDRAPRVVSTETLAAVTRMVMRTTHATYGQTFHQTRFGKCW